MLVVCLDIEYSSATRDRAGYLNYLLVLLSLDLRASHTHRERNALSSDYHYILTELVLSKKSRLSFIKYTRFLAGVSGIGLIHCPRCPCQYRSRYVTSLVSQANLTPTTDRQCLSTYNLGSSQLAFVDLPFRPSANIKRFFPS